jgi:hypothetical protein
MPVIQAFPEIRFLDVNAFRLELKALEASEAGIAFPDTHSHNTEVILGGDAYARVVEIINGYSVMFEDGQYAVKLSGANSNILDVKAQNQVSAICTNSAGLIRALIAGDVWGAPSADHQDDGTMGKLMRQTWAGRFGISF